MACTGGKCTCAGCLEGQSAVRWTPSSSARQLHPLSLWCPLPLRPPSAAASFVLRLLTSWVDTRNLRTPERASSNEKYVSCCLQMPCCESAHWKANSCRGNTCETRFTVSAYSHTDSHALISVVPVRARKTFSFSHSSLKHPPSMAPSPPLGRRRRRRRPRWRGSAAPGDACLSPPPRACHRTPPAAPPAASLRA